MFRNFSTAPVPVRSCALWILGVLTFANCVLTEAFSQTTTISVPCSGPHSVTSDSYVFFDHSAGSCTISDTAPSLAENDVSFHTSVMSSGEARFSFFKSGGPTATRSGFTNCQFGHLTVATDMPCASDRPLTTPITQQVTLTFVSGHFTIRMTVQYNFAAPVFLPLNFYSIQPDHSYVTITMPGEAHSG